MKKYWMYVWAMASFFALAPLAMAEMFTGNGYFEMTSVDMKYRVENGQVKIDSISWGFMPNDTYPCEAILKKFGHGGTFESCFLARSIKGAVTERKYTKVRDLTNAQLVAFLETTGVVGAEGSSPYTYFTLGIKTSRGSQGSYIPSSFNSEAGIIPPVKPPPPPLSCYIGSGTINHGQLASTSVNKHSASTTVSVACTGATNVRVRALSYNANGGMTLNGPETLKSLITIDGVSAELGVVKRVESSRSFTVNSVLSAATEIAGGEYSGSLIIVVSTQ